MGNVSWKLPPTPAELLEDAKARRMEELNRTYTAIMQPLVKSYPGIERESWGEQKTEALAYQAWLDEGEQGDPPAAPVLARILAGRNGATGTETLAELVGKVLGNVGHFVAAQELTGQRHRIEKQIENAASVAAVDAVDLVFEPPAPGA